MAFSIIYKRLLEVDVFHEYYLNQGETLYDALPEEVLNERLGNYSLLRDMSFRLESPNSKLVFKPTPNGFFISVKVEDRVSPSDGFKPFFPMGEYQKFTILADLINPVFHNFTNLPLQAQDDKVFYFSNIGSKTFPSLSNPIAKYKSGEQYQPGDLAIRTDKLYEAIKTTTKIPTGADWVERPDKPYVSSADVVDVVYANISHELTSTNVTELTMSVIDENNPDINKQLAFQQTWDADDPLEVVQVNLSSVKVGRYKFKFEGSGGYLEEFSAYLWSKPEKLPFAIFEIFHKTGLGDYALLDDVAGTLSTPKFELRLKNRASYWRYIFPNSIMLDPTSDLEQDGTNERLAITKSSKHLTNSYNLLSIEKDGNLINLPNPSPSQLRPEKDESDPEKIEKVVSEIFM